MTRSRRGRRGGHGGGGGGGGGHGGGDSRWLVTYADLLTLLMVLFLVLWVISTIDLKKFEKFKSGLGDFGNKAASAAKPVEPTPDPNGLPESSTSTSSTTSTTTAAGTATSGTDVGGGTGTKPLDAQALSGMVDGLNSSINSKGFGDVVNVHVEQRGLVVSITTDNVLFDSGQGVLTSAGAQIISSVGPELAGLANDMMIEGYTDKRPLKKQGYDNWDLSVDRAVSVLKVLRDDFGVAPSRLAATGYGDQHPIAAGDDNASMARNRRIEIVVLAGPAS